MNDCEMCPLEDTEECTDCHNKTAKVLVKECIGCCDKCSNYDKCEAMKAESVDMVEAKLKEILLRESMRISESIRLK